MKYITLLLSLSLIGWISACKKKEVPTPVSQQIAQTWKVKVARHNGTVVYTAGGTSNIVAGYEQFRLSLNGSGTVILKEVEGNTFNGQWELSDEQKRLTLKNLIPVPTSTNGSIEYSIKSVSETEWQLVRLSNSPKTGGSMNEYTLMPD